MIYNPYQYSYPYYSIGGTKVSSSGASQSSPSDISLSSLQNYDTTPAIIEPTTGTSKNSLPSWLSFLIPVLKPLTQKTLSTIPGTTPAGTTGITGITGTTGITETGGTIGGEIIGGVKGGLEQKQLLAEGLGKEEPPTYAPPDKSEIINSLQSQYDTLVKQIETQYNEQIKSLQAMTEEREKLLKQYSATSEEYLKKYGELATKPLAGIYEQKLDEYRVKQNYFENQALLGELKMIMNEMNMSYLRGIELIRIGAISKNEWTRRQNELTARAGVLQAVLNARNNQISTALNIVDKVYNVIRDDTERELNYYKTVIGYYDQLRKETKSEIADLTKEQRQYINAKINLDASKLAQIEKTVNYVKELMLNPQYATKLAYAGVSLTDDIPTINRKLAEWAYVEELQTIAKAMIQRGYSEILIPEELNLYPKEAIVQWKDSKGKIHYFVNTNFFKGKVTYKDFTDNQGNVTRVYTETDNLGNVVRTWVEQLGQYGKASTAGTSGMAGILNTILGEQDIGITSWEDIEKILEPNP